MTAGKRIATKPITLKARGSVDQRRRAGTVEFRFLGLDEYNLIALVAASLATC